jgi:2-desacetyl-2-hydroxyethyl bacteriochlorophyllide A dehydrogenase
MSTTDRMRARQLVFVAPRLVRLRSLDLDEPGDDQVLVRTTMTGISGGTEMLAYRGEIDPETTLDDTLPALTGSFRYPFSYGYSAVGTVERSNADLTEGTEVFAFHPHQDRFVADADALIPLGDVPARIGTLLPLAETGLQVALDADVRFGDVAVVMGLGPVGTFSGAVLARAGADVLGVDPNPFRRDVAKRFGISPHPPEDARAAVLEAAPGGAPVVVEASGDPAVLGSALDLLGHEGTAIVASWYGQKEARLALGAAFHRRRLTIRSSQVSTIPARLAATWDLARRRDAALQLLRELPVESLATHEFPFERAADAYAAIDRGDEELIHAALTYR